LSLEIFLTLVKFCWLLQAVVGLKKFHASNSLAPTRFAKCAQSGPLSPFPHSSSSNNQEVATLWIHMGHTVCQFSQNTDCTQILYII